jgi:hypothetical protein
MLQITHWGIHHSYGINQAFVVHELWPEEPNVPGRGMHLVQLAALEVVAAMDAVSDEMQIRIAGAISTDKKQAGNATDRPKSSGPEFAVLAYE